MKRVLMVSINSKLELEIAKQLIANNYIVRTIATKVAADHPLLTLPIEIYCTKEHSPADISAGINGCDTIVITNENGGYKKCSSTSIFQNKNIIKWFRYSIEPPAIRSLQLNKYDTDTHQSHINYEKNGHTKPCRKIINLKIADFELASVNIDQQSLLDFTDKIIGAIKMKFNKKVTIEFQTTSIIYKPTQVKFNNMSFYNTLQFWFKILLDEMVLK